MTNIVILWKELLLEENRITTLFNCKLFPRILPFSCTYIDMGTIFDLIGF